MIDVRRTLAHWFVLGLTVVPAFASAMNLTGSWTLQLSAFGTYPTTIAQSGTSVVFTLTGAAGPMSGTIDSTAGAFIVGGVDPTSLSCAGLEGVASADGNSMNGTVTTGPLVCVGLHPPNCHCALSPSGTFTGCRNGIGAGCCGNGVLDPGEVCDEGGANGGTSCCDTTCQFESAGTFCDAPGECAIATCDSAGTCAHDAAPDGTSCSDDGNACTADACSAGVCTHPPTTGSPCASDGAACTSDVCDATGVCRHDPIPDSDGDHLCDVIDLCPGGAAAPRPFLAIAGFTTAPGDDRLAIKAALQFSPAVALDPLHDGIRLRIVDADAVPLVDVTVPPGAFDGVRGWRSGRAGLTFRYRSPTPVGGVVSRVRIRSSARAPGTARVTISGTRASIASSAPSLPPSVTMGFDPPAVSPCADLTFLGPTAACTFSGRLLRCR